MVKLDKFAKTFLTPESLGTFNNVEVGISFGNPMEAKSNGVYINTNASKTLNKKTLTQTLYDNYLPTNPFVKRKKDLFIDGAFQLQNSFPFINLEDYSLLTTNDELYNLPNDTFISYLGTRKLYTLWYSPILEGHNIYLNETTKVTEGIIGTKVNTELRMRREMIMELRNATKSTINILKLDVASVTFAIEDTDYYILDVSTTIIPPHIQNRLKCVLPHMIFLKGMEKNTFRKSVALPHINYDQISEYSFENY